MRDFYPEDMVTRNAIFDAWKKAALLHCFQPYDACVVESLDLLKRKSGEEITDQIYSFHDKSGRELALRPEMTPTLARMVASRQGSLSFPLKWHAIAQCFRYERMTKGRKREHYQWNLDIIGEESLSAEIEVVAAAVAALSIVGLPKRDFVVKFNNRALLSDILTSLQVKPSLHQSIYMVLDKRGKIPDDEIRRMFAELGLGAADVERVLSILAVASLEDALALLGRKTPSYEAAVRFLELSALYDLSSVLQFDIGIIRGLSYYTGIVFEAYDIEMKSRAIFGGGRYDNLLADIGGKAATAVGLGFGDVVISELLADKGVTPALQQVSAVAVGFMDDAQRTTAMRVAHILRSRGRNADLATRPEKPKTFFSRCGGNPIFAEAIYIGPDDLAKGKLRIKNLADRTEVEKDLHEFA